MKKEVIFVGFHSFEGYVVPFMFFDSFASAQRYMDSDEFVSLAEVCPSRNYSIFTRYIVD